MSKLENHEQKLLESIESDEWRSVPDREAEVSRYREYASATFNSSSTPGLYVCIVSLPVACAFVVVLALSSDSFVFYYTTTMYFLANLGCTVLYLMISFGVVPMSAFA